MIPVSALKHSLTKRSDRILIDAKIRSFHQRWWPLVEEKWNSNLK